MGIAHRAEFRPLGRVSGVQCGGRRLAAVGQGDQPGLHVLGPDGGDVGRHAAVGQDASEQVDRVEVGLDGARCLVAGALMALEARARRVRRKMGRLRVGLGPLAAGIAGIVWTISEAGCVTSPWRIRAV